MTLSFFPLSRDVLVVRAYFVQTVTREALNLAGQQADFDLELRQALLETAPPAAAAERTGRLARLRRRVIARDVIAARRAASCLLNSEPWQASQAFTFSLHSDL
jgi:hypothetical protein